MHEATLMDLFANPETIHSLSMGEKFVGSLVTTGMGMGITFGILILLCFIIMLMTKILGVSSRNGKKAEPAAAPVQAAAAPTVPEPEEDLMNDEELVAVITAAIMAAQGPGKQNDLYIRKIRRTSDDTPTWSRAGNKDTFNSRF